MKKVIGVSIFLIGFTVFALIVLNNTSECLYLLNWGEYINHDLVEKFEEKYNCKVIEENVVSSEAMYQKITSNTTSYDVAIPGDYTVYQLYREGYLYRIDCENSEYENLHNYNDMFTDSLSKLINENMIDEETGKVFNDYFMPYFWGAYSIIYNDNKSDVPEVVASKGFECLYDRSLFKEEVKIGMYDTARWIVTSYLLSQNLDPNITSKESNQIENDISVSLQNEIINSLKQIKFDEFNNDQLKRNVANGFLDLCYTQLGDYFDALYLVYEESTKDVNINFNVFVPNNTAAFFDSMVIPVTSQNVTLANSFINFMLDPENAYENARAIGYSPTLKDVCNIFLIEAENNEYYYGDENSEISLTLKDFLEKYPVYLDPLVNSKEVYLLKPKSNKYLTTCETIFNSLS